MIRISAWAFAVLLAGCTTSSSAPRSAPHPARDMPSFRGEENEWWLVQVTEPVDRDDVLPAFEASARSYGCSTAELGRESTFNIHGEMRSYYGITASCHEGTIALITLVGGRVSIGCAKPTTGEACDLLLRNIAQAR